MRRHIRAMCDTSGRFRLKRRTVQPATGLAIGLGLLLVSMPLYTSAENRPILGRWSYPYVGSMLVVAVAMMSFVAWSVTRRRRAPGAGSSMSSRLVGIASLCWGTGYLITSLGDHNQAARLLDLNVFGAANPAGAALDWLTGTLLVVAALAAARRHLHGRLSGPIILAATMLVMLLVFEGAMRLKAFVRPQPMGFPTYSGEIWVDRFVELNSMGFRDSEHAVRKVDGLRQVLVVGDSYAFGVGLDDPSQRFGEHLTRSLEAATGQDWELLNASRGNTHTLDHVEFLRQMLVFDPDLVVLQYVFNDIDYLVPVTPRSALTAGSGGILRRLHPARLGYFNSYLFQEVYVRLRAVAVARRLSDPIAEALADSSILSTHLTDLARFVDLAVSHGAVARIVPVDISVVVSPALRRRYETLIDAAVLNEIPVCSIVDAFVGHDFSELTVNAFDVHPNELANRLAAVDAAPCILSALESRD